ncbi:hypothetical protein MHZ90_19610 [Pantoea sp. ACRSH]|uniref:hypothetical protein n=1 Tax=unclassified Pantoea TaxID=2630326 RepID=UPI001EF4CA4D|nr:MULTISPECIES: hypothetical protein [unclassified Pantoea]MCG7368310.1 hypothetical protein [Pantoea sp. ACRSH]MCG7398669.1 hypothetical protein [Pantoea sp. ACRSC]
MNNKIPVTLFVDSPEIANDLFILAKQAGIEAIKPESDVNKSTDITSAHKIMLMKAKTLEADISKSDNSTVELSYGEMLAQNYLNKNK